MYHSSTIPMSTTYQALHTFTPYPNHKSRSAFIPRLTDTHTTHFSPFGAINNSAPLPLAYPINIRNSPVSSDTKTHYRHDVCSHVCEASVCPGTYAGGGEASALSTGDGPSVSGLGDGPSGLTGTGSGCRGVWREWVRPGSGCGSYPLGLGLGKVHLYC